MAATVKNPRVLVVYKQPPRASKRIPARAARSHLQTLEKLYAYLQARKIRFQCIPIDQLGPIHRAELVITVGGDGTVLASSHYVQKQPILGIVSFGKTSVGHFCAATASNMTKQLDGIFANKYQPIQLNRLKVSIGRHRIQELVLNDCLFAHGSPAAISDYKLCLDHACEVQRSSGIWVSTAAGSTAAIHAAGGKKMPLQSQDVQYKVREPYRSNGKYELLGEVLPAQSVIKIESHTDHGTLSIDGTHIQYPVSTGTTVTIREAKQPLHIYWK